MSEPGRRLDMAYMMAGQLSEIERLRLQSRVWAPAGKRLLARLGDGRGLRVLEVGCGVMGWLPILSQWVGAPGEVIGTDVDEKMRASAEALCDEESLGNVRIVDDDIFDSALPEASFQLVHMRFQLAPIGRAMEQLSAARRLVTPNGWIVLEDPDAGSWRENPLAPSAARLRSLVVEVFARSGGDFNAGRRLPEYLRAVGVDPAVHCECIALEPAHPYLQLPVQFATSLRPKLIQLIDESELDRLLDAARAELADPIRWGETFTLVQAWGRVS
jgi:ubiquinone/menaquinone biosynthesis C-methylase UbiE